MGRRGGERCAAERVRRTSYPQAEELAARNVLAPPSAEEVLAMLAPVQLGAPPR